MNELDILQLKTKLKWGNFCASFSNLVWIYNICGISDYFSGSIYMLILSEIS